MHEEPEHEAHTTVPFWRRWWPSAQERQAQLEDRLRGLDEAIARHPDEPANYVVRGELYLKLNHYDLAARDFQRGLELARRDLETRNWGIVAQTMQDRALKGLERAQKHLPRR
jgi:tetratricopeptide (TPR) repeat protein